MHCLRIAERRRALRWFAGAGAAALPAAASAAVYADAAAYPGSAARPARVTTAGDGVFGDDTAAQVAQRTPALLGDSANAYVGSALIGVAR